MNFTLIHLLKRICRQGGRPGPAKGTFNKKPVWTLWSWSGMCVISRGCKQQVLGVQLGVTKENEEATVVFPPHNTFTPSTMQSKHGKFERKSEAAFAWVQGGTKCIHISPSCDPIMGNIEEHMGKRCPKPLFVPHCLHKVNMFFMTNPLQMVVS